MIRSILGCVVFAGVTLAAHMDVVDKRQSCPYGEGYFPSCGQCCNDLGLAGCYAPVDGPDAGEWACYDYPPGDIVSTVYYSSYYSSAGYYASSNAYYGSSGGYSSSAPSYPSASSNPYYGGSSSGGSYYSSSAGGSYGYTSSDSSPGYTPRPAPSLPSASTSFGLPGPSGSASPSQIPAGGAVEAAGSVGIIWRFAAGAVGLAFWL